MNIIIRGKHDHVGKTRSQQEETLRKEWGPTMSDEQLDKLKYIERGLKGSTGSDKNFIPGHEIDKIK